MGKGICRLLLSGLNLSSLHPSPCQSMSDKLESVQCIRETRNRKSCLNLNTEVGQDCGTGETREAGGGGGRGRGRISTTFSLYSIIPTFTKHLPVRDTSINIPSSSSYTKGLPVNPTYWDNSFGKKNTTDFTVLHRRPRIEGSRNHLLFRSSSILSGNLRRNEIGCFHFS